MKLSAVFSIASEFYVSHNSACDMSILAIETAIVTTAERKAFRAGKRAVSKENIGIPFHRDKM